MKHFPEIIDLHMHTTVSDGTDTPEQILENVVRAGIDMFSVTDHDAIEGAVGLKRKIALNSENLPLFIAGVEFSCQDKHGKYHILGYGYDENAPAINVLAAKAHDLRISKVTNRLDFLKKEFGFIFKSEDIEKLFQNSNPGKPHISKMMIRYGYAASIDDAMNNYLNKKKFRNAYIAPEEAITAILDSSGIPVLAHPCYGDGTQLILGDQMDDRLRRLIDFGIKGMECYYSGFTGKLVGEMLNFAEKYDLYVTAGSDYHGGNKLVKLGDTNLADTGKAHRRLKDFLERFI